MASIFSFSHNVIYPSQKEFQFLISSYIILSSANALNMDV